MGRTTGAFFKHGVENRLWVRKLLGISDTLRGATGQSFHVFKKRGVKAVTLGDARYVPITRIVRERVEEEDEVGLELELGPVLEHGIMILPLPIVVPPAVYNTTDTSTYLGGTGSILPSAGYGQFLIGAVGSLSSAYIWTADPAYWAGVSYNSTVWTSPTTLGQLLLAVNQADPSVWSGLARLFVQVLNGSGRLLTAVVSGAEPDSDGLVRLWDSDLGMYRYWWVRTTEGGGVTARVGVAHGEGLVALVWLSAAKAGTLALTDADRQFLETWVLRRMTFEAAVEVLPASGLTSVYTGGKEPTAHGWNYSRLRIGTTLEDVAKASTVTLKLHTTDSGNWYAEGDHWHIEFSLSSGALSATLSQQEGPTFWAGGIQEDVWRPSVQGGYCRIDGSGVGDSSMGDDAPVYTSWGDTQENVLRWATLGTAVRAAGDPLTIPAVCSSGADSSSTFTSHTAKVGGPYIGGTAADASLDVAEGIIESSRNLTVVETGEESIDWYEFSGVPPGDAVYILNAQDAGLSPPATTNQCLKNYSANPLRPRAGESGPNSYAATTTLTLATYTGTATTDTKSLYDWGRVAVITYDPEAVLIMYQKRENVVRSQEIYVKSGGAQPNSSKVEAIRPTENPGIIFRVNFITKWVGVAGGFATSVGHPHGHGFQAGWANYPNPTTTTNTSFTSDQVEGWLVTGTDVKALDIGYEDWGAFYVTEAESACVGKIFSSLFSYNGGEGWYHNKPSEFAFSGPFTQSPATHVYIPVGAS